MIQCSYSTFFFGELKAKDEIKVQKILEFIRTDFSSFIWMLADDLSPSALTVFQGNAKITQIPLMLRRKLGGTADTSWFYPSFAEERPCRRKFCLPNPPWSFQILSMFACQNKASTLTIPTWVGQGSGEGPEGRNVATPSHSRSSSSPAAQLLTTSY